MARTDWLEGLNRRAKNLVAEAERKEIGEFEGAFYNKFPLHEYILSDGRILREAVQESPWASGPHFFIALKEEEEWVPESLWTEEEINEVLGPPVWSGTRLPENDEEADKVMEGHRKAREAR